MEFCSILDLKESPYKEIPRPCFFQDLNIDRIIDQIQAGWEGKIANYYFYLPADEESENYRREIWRDVEGDGRYEIFCNFIEDMKVRNEAKYKKEVVKLPIQKAVWMVWEVNYYCQALSALMEAIEKEEFKSCGLIAFRDKLKEYLSGNDNVEMKNRAKALYEQLMKFRITFTYEKNQMVISEGEVEGKYEAFLKKRFGDKVTKLENPFPNSNDANAFEQEVLTIFYKKKTEYFKEVMAFTKKYKEYENSLFITFAEEIQYYLSFYAFMLQMRKDGFSFGIPTNDTKQRMGAKGLYDLALAVVNSKEQKPVISNDFFMDEDESFFVLTGPNQGGKTTFARSLGQMVYFSKMGLSVPAREANVPFFKDILTHFSVEESVESGRGKLKEELVRLAPMMNEKYDNAFVILNELFTTAANYDACIMGKDVLAHFIGLNCKGIYVTHLKELTEEHDKIVSIRAALDENKMQSFCIIRAAADDTACAVNQINKHRLTYEQLKERLS